MTTGTQFRRDRTKILIPFILWLTGCLMFVSAETNYGRPKLLVFMIDGFRWDYFDLHKMEMNSIAEFLAEGVQADWVDPVFPSMSFPGWATLSTGVYPETHGLLGNTMYNISSGDKFTLTDMTKTGNGNPIWWQSSEPIWTTAGKAGLKTFLRYWSRCDIPFHGVFPNGECTRYNETNGIRAIQETLEITSYKLHFENDIDLLMIHGVDIDTVGHRFGPHSPEMTLAIKQLNHVFKKFLATVPKDSVNIIITGDHGMTRAEDFIAVKLEDYLDPVDVTMVVDYGPFTSIFPNHPDNMYRNLKNNMPGVDVYKREEIPERYHYKNNDLVAPILVVARPGYYIHGLGENSKQIPHILKNESSKIDLGVHGYGDMDDLRTIFFARGPAFKKGVKVPPIHMVDIYQIYTHILGIAPQPHNGTWSKVEAMFKS